MAAAPERERRHDPPGVERRRVPTPGLRVERRAEGDGGGDGTPHIVGHAAVFDRWATIYEGRHLTLKEVVRPGAFARAIRERQDVRSLFNHDANFVLGRSTAGTLALAEDPTGLLSDTLPPDTRTIRDLVLSPIERGDVSGMSFAFTVFQGDGARKQEERPDGTLVITTPGERITIRREGDREIEERELLDLDLHDVSPVTYPAYAETDVALRSRIAAREAEARDRRWTPRLDAALARLDAALAR